MKLSVLQLTLPFLTLATWQAFGQDTTQPPETVELKVVISQVKEALNQYQTHLGTGADVLPALSSAEFDFKTTIGTTVGGSINFFIFKIGASREKDTVNDITYTYSVPKPPRIERGKKPTELKDELAKAIQSAAKAIKESGTLGNLTLSKLTVNIQYGVKWDASGGVSFPISLVTIGLSGDKNKNSVQSVKLTFGTPGP